MPAALSYFGTLAEFGTVAEFCTVAEYSFGLLDDCINIPQWHLTKVHSLIISETKKNYKSRKKLGCTSGPSSFLF